MITRLGRRNTKHSQGDYVRRAWARRIYNYFHPEMKKKKSASKEPANLDSIKKMLI
jgi:hypothetical protein